MGCCEHRNLFLTVLEARGPKQDWVPVRPLLGVVDCGFLRSHPGQSRGESISLDSYKGPNLINERFTLILITSQRPPPDTIPLGSRASAYTWGRAHRHSVCTVTCHIGNKHLQQRSPAWRIPQITSGPHTTGWRPLSSRIDIYSVMLTVT